MKQSFRIILILVLFLVGSSVAHAKFSEEELRIKELIKRLEDVNRRHLQIIEEEMKKLSEANKRSSKIFAELASMRNSSRAGDKDGRQTVGKPAEYSRVEELVKKLENSDRRLSKIFADLVPKNYLSNIVKKARKKTAKKPAEDSRHTKDDGLSPRERRFFEIIVKHSRETGMPIPLIMALIEAESSYRPTIQGPVVNVKGRDGVRRPTRAIGLTQLIPSTARYLGVDPHDPEQNIAGGMRYYMEMLGRFKNKSLALAAYNAGPGNVKNGKIPNFPETQKYVKKILEREKYYDDLLKS